MDDPNDLAKSVISGTISQTAARVLETEVAESLLYPAASEVGLLLGEIAGMTRFYATDNINKIFTRWAKHRDGKAIEAEELKRVLPLLPTASLVSDEEMQELWATLIESFSTGSDMVLPSFGQTLAQLTPTEARLLDEAWKRRMYPFRTDGLRAIYYAIQNGSITDEYKDFDDFRNQPNIVLRVEFGVMLSDIIRLGILQRNSTFVEDINGEMEEHLTFSGYGRRFMRVIKGQLRKDEDD